ncbi:hypothetical protein KR009_007642 [Drosophila setifemur]|nr:hypothetical protein KR009_007642 [Drosophila setifemur]
MVTNEEKDLKAKNQVAEGQDIQESDCCGNGCTNCILDNKPRASQCLLMAGKRNVILQYTKFRLNLKEPHPSDSQVLLLHLQHAPDDTEASEDSVLDIPPGHHVMLRIGSHLRPYSPYWSDFLLKEFRILVKLQSGGSMSQKLVALQPNDLLEFRGPIGNYVNDSSLTKCLFIISQGVATAPTLPLVRQVLENEEDMSRIWQLVCARDLHHVYFREELLEFGRNWNYRSCLYLPHQQCGSSACRDTGHCVPDCQQLRKGLRYKEMARIARLDAEELQQHSNPAIGGLRIVIIAGDSRFQKTMAQLAGNALNVEPANIVLL